MRRPAESSRLRETADTLRPHQKIGKFRQEVCRFFSIKDVKKLSVAIDKENMDGILYSRHRDNAKKDSYKSKKSIYFFAENVKMIAIKLSAFDRR